ncbi:MAG: creatininase family protein [Bacillota bacterium]
MDGMQFWDYTSNEMREAAKDAIAILPVASVEQHGPHLPLGTDSIIVSEFAKRLKERLAKGGEQALFLPLLAYGKSNEHLLYPGTITLTAETLMKVLHEIGASCARAGFRKLVFLNGHGGNHEILDLMTREVRIQTGMQVFALHPLLRVMPRNLAEHNLSLCEREARLGIHAGQIETSIILWIDETLVRKELMCEDYPDNFEGCSALDFSETIPFGWMTQDVSKTGTIGNPVRASAEEGGRWLSAVEDALYEAFIDIKNSRASAGGR